MIIIVSIVILNQMWMVSGIAIILTAVANIVCYKVQLKISLGIVLA